VEFNGTSSYVLYPYAADLNPAGPFTVEAWVRPLAVPNSAGTPCPLSSASFATDRSGWQIRERDTGWEFVLYNHVGSGTALNIRGGPTPVAGTWYHLVAVYDGGNGYLYVNGVLATSASAAGFVANLASDASPFTIGMRSSLNNGFWGDVDEVAFYGRALSAAEVQSHYASLPELRIGLSGTQPVVTWPFGTLQQAPAVTGTYTNVPTATSPYAVPAGPSAGFFRVQQ
jgi:hypothetical protein